MRCERGRLEERGPLRCTQRSGVRSSCAARQHDMHTARPWLPVVRANESQMITKWTEAEKVMILDGIKGILADILRAEGYYMDAARTRKATSHGIPKGYRYPYP